MGVFGLFWQESLSRKRVMNPAKKNPGDSRLESPDVLAMRTIVQTPCERVQLTLTVALLAACAANVALVWAWL